MWFGAGLSVAKLFGSGASACASNATSREVFICVEPDDVLPGFSVKEKVPAQQKMAVPDINKLASTPRSQCCSTCVSTSDGSKIGESLERSESSGDMLSPRSQLDWATSLIGGSDSDDSLVGASDSDDDTFSPRNELCGLDAANDIKSFVHGAHSGDGFDPRWLAQTACEERVASSLSGDGTLANVGLNVAGIHQCTLCSQRFGCETALKLHTKYTHQDDEDETEWLPFPSA